LDNPEAAGYLNNMKAAEIINGSNHEAIQNKIALLQYIETQMGFAAGVPKPREGSTRANTNVTDNTRDINQSAVVTNYVFEIHELLWEEVLKSLAPILQRYYKKNPSEIAYCLSDEELAALETSDNTDIGVRVTSDPRLNKALEILKSKADAILQYHERGLSALINLLPMESLTEFKDYINELEMEIQENKMKEIEANQQAMIKAKEEVIEDREDRQEHEMELEKEVTARELQRTKLQSDTQLKATQIRNLLKKL